MIAQPRPLLGGAPALPRFVKTASFPAPGRWRVAVRWMWFAWVVVLSLLPALKRHLGTKGLLHIPGHALIFAISAYVACGLAEPLARRVAKCAAVIGFGCALEALQSGLFGSKYEWGDVLTDACGVVLFLLLAIWADHPLRHPRCGSAGAFGSDDRTIHGDDCLDQDRAKIRSAAGNQDCPSPGGPATFDKL